MPTDPYAPSEQELAEFHIAAMHRLDGAKLLLNPNGLTWLELAEVQAAFYRLWETPAGNVFADLFDNLAAKLRRGEAIIPQARDYGPRARRAVANLVPPDVQTEDAYRTWEPSESARAGYRPFTPDPEL